MKLAFKYADDTAIDLDRVAALRALNACRGLRGSIGGEIPILQLMILLYLYDHDGSNQVDMCKALNMKAAACSRHCKSLSIGYKQDPATGELIAGGQNLIVSKRHPIQTRETMHHLTDDARSIIKAFIGRLEGRTL